MSRGKAGKRNRKLLIAQRSVINSFMNESNFWKESDKPKEYNTSRAQAKFKTPLWITLENEDLLPDGSYLCEFLLRSGDTILGSIDMHWEIWDEKDNCITNDVTHWRNYEQ